MSRDGLILAAWLAGGALAGVVYVECVHPRLWVWRSERRAARYRHPQGIDRDTVITAAMKRGER